MPILTTSLFAPTKAFANAHVQTILPALLRRVPSIIWKRNRIPIPDGDFLDLDWSQNSKQRLVILSHGLEGSSQARYVQGMAHAFSQNGWDALAWNCRGCSGEPNILPRFYHSGSSDDLQTVIEFVFANTDYKQIALVGFSMGANITLKYLGEQGTRVNSRIVAAVGFSAPCDLESCSQKLASLSNAFYMQAFMLSLRRKIKIKRQQHPHQIPKTSLWNVRTFAEFDRFFTAPLHGFKDEKDYWQKASSKPLLGHIRVPTLVVNARDDSFLGDKSFPWDEAKESRFLFLETPEKGGHVGFILDGLHAPYWSERRAIDFINEIVASKH